MIPTNTLSSVFRPALRGLDAHRARLQHLGERGLVACVNRALRGFGGNGFLDPAHDGAARGEPFAPDLAARKLPGGEEIINGIG